MRDVARQEQQDRGVPKRGNEYPDHTKQKERVYRLLNSRGWECYFEREMFCSNPHTGIKNKYPYSLDVYAFRYHNGLYQRIGVEINREKTGGGHGSKITIPKDRNRAQDIWDQHKIKVIPFNVSHMKDASDEDIVREIYQAIGAKI